jgi:sortase A
MNVWIRQLQCGLAIAGVALLGYCLTVFLGARFYQAKAARDFERQRQMEKTITALRRPSTTPAPRPRVGVVVGRLKIPRIGLSVMVVEGADARELKLAAGHIPGTALPDQNGNVGIAGHRDTFFRTLRAIQRNDSIELVTLQKVRRYRVESTEVVTPDDVQVLNPVGHNVLTLVTCFPFNYVGAAPKRFIVRAEPLE